MHSRQWFTKMIKAIEKNNFVCLDARKEGILGGKEGVFPPKICMWLMAESHRRRGRRESATQLAVLSLGS